MAYAENVGFQIYWFLVFLSVAYIGISDIDKKWYLLPFLAKTYI